MDRHEQYDNLVARLVARQPAPSEYDEDTQMIIDASRVLDLALDKTNVVRAELVRRLLIARDEQGLDSYGVSLHTFDGRDSEADLVQELVDAIKYAVKVFFESGERHDYDDVILLIQILDRRLDRACSRG